MIKVDWKDVWSSVVGGIILAIITALYLLMQSWFKDITFNESWSLLINLQVPVIYIIGAVFIVWAIYKLRISGNKLTRKQKLLITFNRFEYTNVDVICKWDIVFQNNKPYVTNLVTYCNKHDIPIKLYQDCCPQRSCPNYDKDFDKRMIKNEVESYVIHEWERINNQN